MQDQTFRFSPLLYLSAAVLPGGLVLYMACGADGLGSVVISVTFILTFLAAAFVATGCIMLFATRRRPQTKRTLLGCGFITYGGLAAGIFMLVSAIADQVWRCETGIFPILQGIMCAGGWMSFAMGLSAMNRMKKNT